MSKFDVPIDKEATCDLTIGEILKSIKFQNKSGNLLVEHKIQTRKVILTYEGD